MNEKKEKEEIVKSGRKRDGRRRFKRTGKKWKLSKRNGKLLTKELER